MGMSFKIKLQLCLLLITSLSTVGFSEPLTTKSKNFKEVKVALLGDTGTDERFAKVLNLVASENAQVIMINGDLGYSDSPAQWEAQLKSAIDTNRFSVIGSLGNHDVSNKDKYIDIFQNFRNAQNELITKCTGTPGVKSGKDITLVDETCTFENVSLISSGIGQVLSDSYLENRLENKLTSMPSENWKLVGYHFTLSSMNPGIKPTEASYNFFDIIRKHGAIGAQAHTHSAMSSCPISSPFSRSQSIECHPDFTDLEQRFVMPGVGLYMDSSISGLSARKRSRCSTPNSKDCQHMVDLITKEGYTRVDGVKRSDFTPQGAIFITFNYMGDPSKAFVYYKSVDGQIIFNYTITR